MGPPILPDATPNTWSLRHESNLNRPNNRCPAFDLFGMDSRRNCEMIKSGRKGHVFGLIGEYRSTKLRT